MVQIGGPRPSEPAAKPPVFVVGCPRSGTTLVRRMLDAHPAFSCGPETQFLTELRVVERRSWRRLARFGVTESEWRAQVRSLFTWVHEQRAERLGKDRWVDKSPGYALILDYVDALFPDCMVVHVIRDPRDVADSWRRRWGQRRAAWVLRAWPRHVTAARAFGRSHPDRYHEVRYEALVADPEAQARALLGWLGEPWSEAVLHPGPAIEPGDDRVRWAAGDPPSSAAGRARPATAKRAGAAGTGGSAAGDVDGEPAPGAAPSRREPDVAPGVSAASVGRGRRRLASRWLIAGLRVTAGPLMRELGYR